ncbi:MAG: hypothetical protein LBT14_01315 [Treponema sp.]|jgi:hypothetical protein|nr:hypothetical protein [Treponema sp.]
MGLLITNLLVRCLVVPFLPAQTDEGYPLVAVQTSPENPVLNAEWKVLLLVDHPVPREVTVRAPPLPNTLGLQRVRTEARVVVRQFPKEQEGDEERQAVRMTAIEFLFTPHGTGMVRLEPFEIILPGNRVKTEAISVYIQGTADPGYPAFTWGTLPRSLRIGQREELFLRRINWDPRKPLPGTHLLLPVLPEQAILEAQTLTKTDQERGVVLRVAVIPLETTTFTLKAHRFQYEGFTLDVPGISIPVIPVPPAHGPSPDETSPSPGLESTLDLPNREALIPFPELFPGIFPLFRLDYERVLYQARNLWNKGQKAEALAELRRNERDSPAGPVLAPFRREAEQRLGLAFTGDEQWRPRSLLLILFLGSLGLLLVLMAPGIFRYYRDPAHKKAVTSDLSWGYKGILIILMVILVVALYGLTESMITRGFRGGHGSDGGSAVLRAAVAYRVPEDGGAVSACFDEGQPVIIRSASGSWAYADSLDGRAGWVLRDTIVFY